MSCHWNPEYNQPPPDAPNLELQPTGFYQPGCAAACSVMQEEHANGWEVGEGRRKHSPKATSGGKNAMIG